MTRRWKGRILPKGTAVIDGLIYVRVFHNGKQFQKSFGDANDPKCVNLAIARLNEIRQQIFEKKFQIEPEARRILVHDAIKLFVDLKPRYKSTLEAVRRYLDGKYLDEVNHVKMLGYREHRKREGVSDSTVNRELTAFSALYYKLRELVELKELEKLQLPEVSPCKHVPRFDERLARRKRVLQVEELRRFLDYAPEDVRVTIKGALNTGLRKKDLFSLSRHNISLGQLEGLQHKVGAAYTVPNNRVINELLGRTDTHVFNSVNFRKKFEQARHRFCAETGTEWFEFRDLRRTAAQKIYDETKDIVAVQHFLGHKSPETTMRYLGISKYDVQKIGQILERSFNL